MKIFRIDRIIFDPFDIIAEDSDHAAQMFIYALMTGLQNQPAIDFSTAEWTKHRTKRYPTVSEWARAGSAGIVWRVDEDQAWELVHYKFDRL